MLSAAIVVAVGGRSSNPFEAVQLGTMLPPPGIISDAYAADRSSLFVGSGQSLAVYSTDSFGLLANCTQNIEDTIEGLAASRDGKPIAYCMGNGGVGVVNNAYLGSPTATTVTGPSSITGGKAGTGSANMSVVSAYGGTPITLTSSSPNVTAPASATAPEGSKSASFAITSSAVSSCHLSHYFGRVRR